VQTPALETVTGQYHPPIELARLDPIEWPPLYWLTRHNTTKIDFLLQNCQFRQLGEWLGGNPTENPRTRLALSEGLI
jgi:hypothetical protein